MNIIELESRENKSIKNLAKLKIKKYRQKEGLFVVENWKIIQDASNGNIFFEEIFVTKNFLEKNKIKLGQIIGKSGVRNLGIVSEKSISQISSLKNPEGIWGLYKKRSGVLDYKKDILYLNAINDPGNLGTILRSALAFGIENIVLDKNCVDVYNAKTIQAAKDAIFKLTLAEDVDGQILNKIKENNLKIYITDVREGVELSEVFFERENICLILGSESQGVSKELSDMAQGFINIKTTNKIESLNVAVSAGIILYELYKSKTKYNKA